MMGRGVIDLPPVDLDDDVHFEFAVAGREHTGDVAGPCGRGARGVGESITDTFRSSRGRTGPTRWSFDHDVIAYHAPNKHLNVIPLQVMSLNPQRCAPVDRPRARDHVEQSREIDDRDTVCAL